MLTAVSVSKSKVEMEILFIFKKLIYQMLRLICISSRS